MFNFKTTPIFFQLPLVSRYAQVLWSVFFYTNLHNIHRMNK